MAERAPGGVAAAWVSRHDGSRMSTTWRTRDRDGDEVREGAPVGQHDRGAAVADQSRLLRVRQRGVDPDPSGADAHGGRNAISTWAGLRTEAATPVPRRTPRLRSADVTRTTSSSSCAYVRRTSGSTTAVEAWCALDRGREEVVDEERI